MSQMTETLKRNPLEVLRAQYNDAPHLVENLLTDTMPDKHLRTKPYVEVLHSLFHDSVRRQERLPEGASKLLGANRERCIITLLAARSSQRNLALHIYIGLMLGIEPEEIGDIIFLSAVYSGAPAMADGMKTAVDTLAALAEVASAQPSIEKVLQKLMEFPL